MVLEIWSATDRIFCHFEPFFALGYTNDLENQNSQTIKKHLEILFFYTSVHLVQVYQNYFFLIDIHSMQG